MIFSFDRSIFKMARQQIALKGSYLPRLAGQAVPCMLASFITHQGLMQDCFGTGPNHNRILISIQSFRYPSPKIAAKDVLLL